MRSLLALVARTTVVTACRADPPPPPSCDQIVDNILKVTKIAMAGHDGMGTGDRPALLARCAKQGLTPAQRTCLVTASDLEGIAACTKPR